MRISPPQSQTAERRKEGAEALLLLLRGAEKDERRQHEADRELGRLASMCWRHDEEYVVPAVDRS